jgi:hypothetical protein
MGLHQDRKLRLMKLHGSLDWIDDAAWGICALRYPEHTNSDDMRGSGPPLLIFGTDTKMMAKDPYLTLLYLFSSRLDETDVLAIVGYSFGNEYLNEVIEQRLISNPRLRLIIVSPGADQMKERTRFLHDNPKVVMLAGTAKEAFEHMTLLREVRRLVDLVRDETPFH